MKNMYKNYFYFPYFLVFRYTIKLTHGSFSWEIRRRYKHFLKLDAELFFHKVNVRRHSLRRDHTPELRHLPSRHLPRRPDMFATTNNMEKRKKALQKYLQVILDNPNYRNHKETLNFLEVSHLSFQYELGQKRTWVIFFSFWAFILFGNFRQWIFLFCSYTYILF